MRRSLLILIFLIFPAHMLAQVEKTILIEHTTNTNCGACVAYEPPVYRYVSERIDRIVVVAYHNNFPDQNDPMFLHNSEEILQRTSQYYAVSMNPSFFVDGKEVSFKKAIFRELEDKLNEQSPLALDLNAEFSADTIIANVRLEVLSEILQRDLRLRLAVVEKQVEFDEPPGRYGQRIFHNVFRRFFLGAAGLDLGTVEVGDVRNYHFSLPIDPQWNPDELVLVAWVQTDETKEVLQAATDVPRHVFFCREKDAELLAPGQEKMRDYFVKNPNGQALRLEVSAEVLDLPSGWEYSFKYGNATGKVLFVDVPPHAEVSFAFVIKAGAEPGTAKMKIKVRNISYHYAFETELDYQGIVPGGSILFVDDDFDPNFPYVVNRTEIAYLQTLENVGVQFTAIPQDLFGEIDLKSFTAIIWSCGWQGTLDNEDCWKLIDYLDGGGRILIAGNSIMAGTQFAGSQLWNFYTNYLGAKFSFEMKDWLMKNRLVGLRGNPISDGLRFEISLYQNPVEQVLVPRLQLGADHSSFLLRWQDSLNKYGAIMSETDTFKTVYLGFGLNAIVDSSSSPNNNKARLLRRILEWFEVPTPVRSIKARPPMRFSLEQNYPNPFNSGTRITYSVGSREHVVLKVFDARGREVRLLVNTVQPAGTYTISFDGSNLPSGVYIYELKSESFRSVKKMILLR